MREAITVEAVRPVKGKALVRLVEKSLLEDREFSVVRLSYDPTDDWELGVVEALGEGDWDSVEIGSHVIVRAGLGGKAGSDISKALGERRESHVIVSAEEIVVQVVL